MRREFGGEGQEVPRGREVDFRGVVMQDSGNAMVRTFFNKKIKQIYSLGAQLSPTVNGIVKDILKSIINFVKPA